MKRHGLLFATLGTLLLTGFTVRQASGPAPQPTVRLSAQAADVDPLATSSGWRWSRNEPSHWRACVLQH